MNLRYDWLKWGRSNPFEVGMLQREFVERGQRLLRRLGCLVPERLLRDQSGTVAVEFGAVALPFFTLVFAILQVALVFVSDQVLDTAVNDAARLIRTGQAKALGWTGTTGIASFNTQVCKELYYLLDCTKLQSYVTTSTSFSSISLTPPINTSTGNFTGTPSYSAAANTGSNIVVVSTYYEYPALFSSFGLSLSDQPNGTRLLGAVAAFRNEPFP
jgi:Flp pilus assembly protein TadG